MSMFMLRLPACLPASRASAEPLHQSIPFFPGAQNALVWCRPVTTAVWRRKRVICPIPPARPVRMMPAAGSSISNPARCSASKGAMRIAVEARADVCVVQPEVIDDRHGLRHVGHFQQQVHRGPVQGGSQAQRRFIAEHADR
jgi:hypothetical protein